MAQITIYQKPTCTTCRKVFGLLKSKNIDFDTVNYYMDPIPQKKLEELLFKMNMSATDLLRKKEPLYKELGLADNNFTEEHIIELMVKNPDLIERPIVERGGKAVLARPAEKVLQII